MDTTTINKEPEVERLPARLVDRLSPVIDKTSSGIANLLEDLIGRALLGGIEKVDEEIGDFVDEKVDATITAQTPRIENMASKVAEIKAREAATEVANRKVDDLEDRTKKSTAELSEEIDRVQHGAHEDTTQKAEELVGQIEKVERKAHENTTQKAEQLVGQIEQVERKAHKDTTQKAEELSEQIANAEKRANEKASSVITHQIQEVVQRSAKTASRITEGLRELDKKTAAIHEELKSALSEQIHELKEVNRELEARIAKLEKPKGFLASFRKVFSRKREDDEEEGA